MQDHFQKKNTVFPKIILPSFEDLVLKEIKFGKQRYGWEGDARGRRYGDIRICIADSFCYKAETNPPL